MSASHGMIAFHWESIIQQNRLVLLRNAASHWPYSFAWKGSRLLLPLGACRSLWKMSFCWCLVPYPELSPNCGWLFSIHSWLEHMEQCEEKLACQALAKEPRHQDLRLDFLSESFFQILGCMFENIACANDATTCRGALCVPVCLPGEPRVLGLLHARFTD